MDLVFLSLPGLSMLLGLRSHLDLRGIFRLEKRIAIGAMLSLLLSPISLSYSHALAQLGEPGSSVGLLGDPQAWKSLGAFAGITFACYGAGWLADALVRSRSGRPQGAGSPQALTRHGGKRAKNVPVSLPERIVAKGLARWARFLGDVLYGDDWKDDSDVQIWSSGFKGAIIIKTPVDTFVGLVGQGHAGQYQTSPNFDSLGIKTGYTLSPCVRLVAGGGPKKCGPTIIRIGMIEWMAIEAM